MRAAAVQIACVVFLASGAIACQPLYGSKAEHLKNPSKKRKPKEADAPPPEIKYVEDCSADFRGDPHRVHAQGTLSRRLVQEGDTALDQAKKTPQENVKVGLWKDAIEKYRNALIKDPFSVEATLKLAIAYDKVLRKGCAIAMLKRLASLSNNPKWANEANRNIDAIDANSGWFKGYRKDAMAAVGR